MSFQVKVVLGGDGTGFDVMMNRADAKIKKLASQGITPLKNAIGSLFTVGAISALAKETIQFAGHLRDVSDELGVNVEWLQAMGAVAKTSGANVDDLETVMRKLTQSRVEALGAGGEKQMAAFNKFGISAEQVQTGKLTDIMDQIAKAFETGAQQNLLPAFAAIGGKGAAKLIPAFLDGIEEGRKEAAESGQVMAEDLVDQLDAIGDSMERLKTKALVGIGQQLPSIVGWFEQLINVMRGWLAYVGGFFSQMSTQGWFSKDMHELAGKVLEAHEMGKTTKAMEIVDQGEEKARDDRRAALRKQLRHERENAPIELQPLAPAKKFFPGSDSLTAVGNFLGSSGRDIGAEIVSIGQRTNELLGMAVTRLGNIERNTMGSGDGDPFGVAGYV